MSYREASAISGGPGKWAAHLPVGWDIMGVTNGGFVMSIATKAMEAEADDRVLISSTGSFVNPARPGDVSIVVEELKTGRMLSTLRATVAQEGRDVLHVVGVFSDPDRSANEAELIDGEPPDLPAVEDCIPVLPAEDAPFPPPFMEKIDLRLHPADAQAFLGEKSERAVMRGWLRLRDDEQFDCHSVVMACDALPPTIFTIDLPIGWTPTVDLAVQVRNPRPSGWLACGFRTRFITAGLLEEDGEIWDADGRPVALSRQLALVPR